MRDNQLVFDDEKVLFAIQGAKTLYRNPLAHPQERLTIDEAIGLVGLTQNIVSQILRHLDIVVPISKPSAIDELGSALSISNHAEVVKVAFTKKDIKIEIKDGRTVSLPLQWFPKIRSASIAQRKNIVIAPNKLHWPDLEIDIWVADYLVR